MDAAKMEIVTVMSCASLASSSSFCACLSSLIILFVWLRRISPYLVRTMFLPDRRNRGTPNSCSSILMVWGQRRLGNVKRFRRVGQMLELCGLLEIGQCKKREFHKSLLGIIYNLLLIYKLYALLYKIFQLAHGILLSKVMNIS